MKIMETIHVKFDKHTTMASENNSLEPDSNCMKFEYPSTKPYQTPTKEDLDDLFEATHIVSTSTEQTPSQSNEVAEGSNQDDTTELDGMNSSILLWTKAHPLEQILGDLSKPIMTRSKLSNDVEMCVYALNVSLVEPSNIKEAMAYHSCIEAMKEELH
ncbi:hypothetical protein Tco_0803362 [Tanacetum coccineum]|uniref:Gag-pol polyprotein n=1 Tax=Tanacetum coccineum TaxID=301880 RepID=A0ABQ5A1C5_9ASTR